MRIESMTCTAESPKAILVEGEFPNGALSAWVPKSYIELGPEELGGSPVRRDGDVGDLVVDDDYAARRGWAPAEE